MLGAPVSKSRPPALGTVGPGDQRSAPVPWINCADIFAFSLSEKKKEMLSKPGRLESWEIQTHAINALENSTKKKTLC